MRSRLKEYWKSTSQTCRSPYTRLNFAFFKFKVRRSVTTGAGNAAVYPNYFQIREGGRWTTYSSVGPQPSNSKSLGAWRIGHARTCLVTPLGIIEWFRTSSGLRDLDTGYLIQDSKTTIHCGWTESGYPCASDSPVPCQSTFVNS